MSTLYLLNYNNYYNRIVRKEEDTVETQEDTDGNITGVVVTETALSKYTEHVLSIGEEGSKVDAIFQNVNFNPYNYIDTTQVVNWSGDVPNYLLNVIENEIVSRWFVVNYERTTNGQLLLYLHRDVVVDNYTAISEADVFCERGTINNEDDPAIFNDEGISFNQVKVDETLIKDETDCPWIVGFMPTDALDDVDPASRKITVDVPYSDTYDEEVNSILDWKYYQYVDKGVAGYIPRALVGVRFEVRGSVGIPVGYNTAQVLFDWDANTVTKKRVDPGDVSTNLWFYTYAGATLNSQVSKMNDKIEDAGASIRTAMYGHYNLNNDVKTYNELLQYGQPKIIYDKTQKKAYVAQVTLEEQVIEGNWSSTSNNMSSTIYNAAISAGGLKGNGNGAQTVRTSVRIRKAYLTLKEQVAGYSVTIPQAIARNSLIDEPFDMFCIPYSDELKVITTSETGVETVVIQSTKKDIAAAIGSHIAAKLGDKAIYDVMLLPFCPVRENIVRKGVVRYLGAGASQYIVDEQGNNVGVMYWGTRSKFTFDIPFERAPESTPLEKKIKSLTQLYRLNSPNYNGSFDFDLQKNNGIQFIKVDCSYKPFAPYIHLAPNFGGLYGADYNDQRGLVCGGDFSLSQVTKDWANYQFNNKNYIALFDRQIQNMEVQHDVAREQEKWSVAAGAFGAFGQSVSTGAMFGPWGAAVGAVVGVGAAGLSAAAGNKDRALNERLRQEGINFAKDTFELNLQNIQALPYGLAKTSAMTNNNKVFPFLELYTSQTRSEYLEGDEGEQVKQLRKKIKYRAMNVQKFGKIGDFTSIDGPAYVKCRLIRLEGLEEDSHIIEAIARELYEGVFI